jgi:hypothetical protein
MKGLVRLYDWLLSFMDSISPRPLIVGIEQRHVHSAVIIRAARASGLTLRRVVAAAHDLGRHPCFYENRM